MGGGVLCHELDLCITTLPISKVDRLMLPIFADWPLIQGSPGVYNVL